ncbi:Fur family transcriptional regulator [Allorhizocola rhizosphaerae]|uniref:Fur family transcriptional regulator n=1 Tax=Allorhizocola rhizosphaerae TaxID=1872709 RepID=UPI000E3BC6C9|nr:Fur family transcriptional regulator [Allorhizocola rhizosphaerae]
MLRERGLRLTPQRQLVLEAVRRLGHATPEQVHEAVVANSPGVNITTIYRTLELLEELDLITHVHLSHGALTYHWASEDQHVHLVCRKCESVQELDVAELRPLAARLQEQYGFRLDIAHVALFGECKECQ